ncbi:MAG: glycosyltransferase N-terminal domain-containing protein, partial [Thermodesulfobacteriota bacterium]|nr:glycosyltransferase N-terminal domain-containing protein [Thermodesulfobacteriota bacterium]
MIKAEPEVGYLYAHSIAPFPLGTRPPFFDRVRSVITIPPGLCRQGASIVLDSGAKEHYVPFPMNTFIYNILLLFASLFLLPYYASRILLTGKYRRSLGPKFGLYSKGLAGIVKGTPRIWVHAVSVGEVTAAAPIVAALRERFPLAAIVLSTSTETGQEMARKTIKGTTAFIYFPLDIPFVIRRVLNRVKPDIFIPVETEVW